LIEAAIQAGELIATREVLVCLDKRGRLLARIV
jgi:hypothetical protein